MTPVKRGPGRPLHDPADKKQTQNFGIKVGLLEKLKALSAKTERPLSYHANRALEAYLK